MLIRVVICLVTAIVVLMMFSSKGRCYLCLRHEDDSGDQNGSVCQKIGAEQERHVQWCSTSNRKPFPHQVRLLQSFQKIARSIPECFSSTSKTSFREFAVIGRLKWLHTSGSSQACGTFRSTATCRNGEPYPEPTEQSNHRQ